MTVVFLDRDGVINRNRDDYVKTVGELEFLPGSLEGLARLKGSGVTVVVVSNQAGVGRGLIEPIELERIDRELSLEAERHGGEIAASFYCTHRKDEGCNCRKPQPGLFLKASEALGFDLSDAYFVGDTASDVEAGCRAGIRTVLVLTGLASDGDACGWQYKPDHVAVDLPSAVEWILAAENKPH
ncbi:MAG TPA: HAD-IIIA family hydrolase [Armatimonadota bacterium]